LVEEKQLAHLRRGSAGDIMSSVIARSLALTATAFGVSLAAPSGAADIVARAPTGVTAQAERLLAAVAEPRILDMEPGHDVADLARRLCGRLTPTYFGILLAANWNRADSSKVVIPACFVVRRDEKVRVASGESMADLAERSVGIAGPKTLRGIFDSNDGWASTAATTAMATEPIAHQVREVTVPLVTEPVVYSLRPGKDATEVSQQLIAALEVPTTVSNLPAPAAELTLEAGIPPGTGLPATCQAAGTVKYNSWPFAVSEVAAVIDRNNTYRAASPLGPVVPEIVAVVDNGIDGIFTPAFPTEDFDLNAAEFASHGGNADPDQNGYPGDIVGTNIFDGGQPQAFAQSVQPAHGTMMTSLALGGPDYRAWQQTAFPHRLVKVRVVSIVRRSVETSTTGNVTRYALPTESLGTALQYVLSGKARTVNLSVSTPNRLQAIEDVVHNHSDLLLVVAAGNAAYELDQKSRYPASESAANRAYGGRVVTVASHGRSGCLSSFSGRGKETVDLAAPGEQIRATELGGQETTTEGTSQATAITSFVAALLRSTAGMAPAGIKDRLIASVDLSPDLAPYVRSEGALNPAKALNVFYDSVEVLRGSKETIIGTLDSPLSPGVVCPALQSDQRNVLKVSKRVDGGDDQQIRLLLRNPEKEGELQVIYCAPAAASIAMTKMDGSHTSFTLGELVDLVPRI
jgi:hypothetical protein